MKTWEEAVRHCVETPALADLARDAYFGDPVEAAARYHRSPEFQELKTMLPLRPGRALDLGAGNGILSWALAKEGWDVTAVEPDPSDYIGAGAIRDLSRKTGVDITVIEAMGEDIPLSSANFDLVAARQVLHHANDLDAFCREMARLSRPGATIVTLRDHVISGEHQLQAFLDKHPLHHLYGGENAFTLPQYRTALTNADLTIVSEMRSFDSVLNYDPMSQQDIIEKLAAVAGPAQPLLKPLLNLLPFGVLSRLATSMDRRPGRLVSFLLRTTRQLETVTHPIWITGIQGFIGSHLAEKLVLMGHEVLGFGRAKTAVDGVIGTAYYPLSSEGFTSALRTHGPPARAYHFAGGATVGRSLRDPHGDFTSNVTTTALLLEALRPLEARVPVILSSSAAVYGTGHDGPIGIDAATAPTSPYGHHKLMAEQLVQSHAQSFELPASIFRLFSIYGPGLQKQLLFDVCSKLSSQPTDAPLILWGTGREMRDWLHVDDVVDYLVGAPDPAPGQVSRHNLASGQAHEINQIAQMLCDAWGFRGKITFRGIPSPGDPFSLVAAKSGLPSGFMPQIDPTSGVGGFVEWFRETVVPAQ